jgi:mannose-6-phosphate isomerase-like protein (cupin superfamily)
MITLVRSKNADLQSAEMGEDYRGECESKVAIVWKSADEKLEVGFWHFKGWQTTPVHDGYEEVLVLLSGRIQIECEGQEIEAEAGDAVIYAGPVGPQRLTSSEGIHALYAVRRGPFGSPSE